MDAILQTLQDMEGVNGAVIADRTGQVLAYRAHALYDSALLSQVSKAVVTAIDSVKLMQQDWESVTVQFEEGKLLIRSLASGTQGKTPELTLSVIADMRLNVSFAGVALRVAVAKLKAIFEAGNGMPDFTGGMVPVIKSPLPPPAAVPSSSRMGVAAPSPAAQRGSNPEFSASNLNWSGFGGNSSLSGSGIAALDAASSAALAACTKALARSVGPMAKRYVKESLGRICPDRPFTKEMIPALVVELEKYLEDPGHADEFRKTAMKAR
jgi:predicted regulator of Ras-like GTPase activity (Roadblock/LC7/MglB family)